MEREQAFCDREFRDGDKSMALGLFPTHSAAPTR